MGGKKGKAIGFLLPGDTFPPERRIKGGSGPLLCALLFRVEPRANGKSMAANGLTTSRRDLHEGATKTSFSALAFHPLTPWRRNSPSVLTGYSLILSVSRPRTPTALFASRSRQRQPFTQPTRRSNYVYTSTRNEDALQSCH